MGYRRHRSNEPSVVQITAPDDTDALQRWIDNELADFLDRVLEIDFSDDEEVRFRETLTEEQEAILDEELEDIYERLEKLHQQLEMLEKRANDLFQSVDELILEMKRTNAPSKRRSQRKKEKEPPLDEEFFKSI